MKGPRNKRRQVLVSNLTVSLPTHLIEKIFIFLPIKDAISSSIVAKPFLNSWLYSRNICFDKIFKWKCYLTGRDEISIIDNIIKSHLGEKVYTFHLFISAQSKYDLKKWIQILASKGLEELELEVSSYINRTTYSSRFKIGWLWLISNSKFKKLTILKIS